MDFDYTTETITPDTTNILTIAGTGGLELPVGTTAERPGSAVAGAIRWNTTETWLEYYSGTSWNTFADSIAGTANQIAALPGTGNVTLSIPTTFIAPGTMQYTTNFGFSFEQIDATGTTQATAAPITKTTADIESGATLSGVILPVPDFLGQYHNVMNSSSNEIYIYPHVGGSIADGVVDVPTYILFGASMCFVWDGVSWDIVVETVDSGNTGISVAHSAGNILISNTGVLSFAGGVTGLTPATATTGAITLGGTLNIANGGTGNTTTTGAFNALSPLTTAGDTIYFNGTNNVRLPAGANGTVLSVVTGEPSWVTQASLNAGTAITSTTATNLAGGSAGSVPYQTAAGATSFVSTGTSSQVLVSGTTPTFVSVPTALGYTPVNKAGDTMTGLLVLSGDPAVGLGAATKQYVDSIATGLIWIPPVNIINLVGTATSPPGSPGLNDAYIIYPGGNTGVWASFSVGNLVQYQVSGWVDMGPVSVGSRFVVAAYAVTTPSGDVAGYKNYLAVITGGTSSAWTWTFTAPVNNWATSVSNTSAAFYGSSWTYSGSLSQWVEFASILHYYAGTGLVLTGTTFSNSGVLSVTTNTGLSTNTSATGNVTITNTGVTSIVAGTGITISGSTGAVTINRVPAVSTTIEVSTTYLATSDMYTVSLPATPNAGEIHNIKKIDQTRYTVTINGNGHNIDKYSTVSMNVPFTNIQLQWNSTSSVWQII
jgi:hypothetical protein